MFSLTPGAIANTLTTISSGDFNTMITDFEADANAARPIVAGGTGATSPEAARTALGVQASNANLTSLAGLTLAANKGLYSTGANTVAMFTLTAAGRALLDDDDAAAQRATLGFGNATTVMLDSVGHNAAVVNTNWDLISGNGWFFGGSGAANAPVSGGFFTAFGSQESANSMVVLAVRVGADEVYLRRKVGGVWDGWTRIDVGAGLGYDQTWQSVTRSGSTTYTNNTGKPIQVAITIPSDSVEAQVSTDGSSWVSLGTGGGTGGGETNTISFIVPPGHRYRTTGAFDTWRELR